MRIIFWDSERVLAHRIADFSMDIKDKRDLEIFESVTFCSKNEERKN